MIIVEAGKVHKNDIFTFFVADVSYMSSVWWWDMRLKKLSQSHAERVRRDKSTTT